MAPLPRPSPVPALVPLVPPTLSTARLRLRPVRTTDLDDLYALHSSAVVLRYWDTPPWRERRQAEQFVARCREVEAEGTGVRLALTEPTGGAFLGWCGLTGWDRVSRTAHVGYVLAQAAWGQGYATEGARALLQWGLDTLDLNRVQGEVDTRHRASARVLEKLGFVLEGTLREDCVVDGEVSDTWVYGLLRREWVEADVPQQP